MPPPRPHVAALKGETPHPRLAPLLSPLGMWGGWGVTAQAALPVPQFPRCSALQVVEHPGLLGMGKPGGLVLPMATSELGGFRGGSNGNIPLGTHPCGGTHHCKRAMLQGGDGVGEAMCRVSRQHGGGPRKSPVGEKGKEEGKTTALLLAARMVCRHGDSTGDRRCSAAPSPRRGAGSAPCALSCILGIILLFFSPPPPPRDALSNLSIYGQEVRSSGRLRGCPGPWGEGWGTVQPQGGRQQ